MALIVRRDCRVQWNRTRRRWLSRLRNPKAIRAASLIIRLVPSVPALVILVSQKAWIWGHQASTVRARRVASGCSRATRYRTSVTISLASRTRWEWSATIVACGNARSTAVR